MNAPQNNKMDSYRASLALLATATETNAIPGFPAKHTAFGKKVDVIVELITDQAAKSAGKVAERDRLFGEMKTTVLGLAGVLRSHADEHHLSELLVTALVNPSDFTGRFEEQVRLAQKIVDAAKPVLAELAPHGITAETLTNAQTAINAARDAQPGPRGAIAARKAATEQLAVAFREVDRFVEMQLEPLLWPLKETHPQFYANYLATRQLVNRRGGRAVASDEATAAKSEAVSTSLAGTEKTST